MKRTVMIAVVAAMVVAGGARAENWANSLGRRSWGGFGGSFGTGTWEIGVPLGFEITGAKDEDTGDYAGRVLTQWGLRGAYGPEDWPVDLTAEVARAADNLFVRWHGRLGVRKVWRADKTFQPTLGAGLELSHLSWEVASVVGDHGDSDLGYGAYATAGFRWAGVHWVFWTDLAYSYLTYNDFGSDVAPFVLYAGIGLGYRGARGW
ncbi:MAG: hypothetical protein D6708_11945 [Candidatus Dadabacteria bacterium]|nr:MAG: hypothetical protein D6708_11945 [Candidatus Dadabacteria bacterium]